MRDELECGPPLCAPCVLDRAFLEHDVFDATLLEVMVQARARLTAANGHRRSTYRVDRGSLAYRFRAALTYCAMVRNKTIECVAFTIYIRLQYVEQSARRYVYLWVTNNALR